MNVICIIPTAMWMDHVARDPLRQKCTGTETAEETFDAVIKSGTPLGRPQTAEDIAEAAVYLEKADNVTGTSLIVAGGQKMN